MTSSSRCVRAAACRLGVMLGVWFVAASAFGHAAPQVLQILWRSADAGVLLVTNRGLVFGDSTGMHWRLMCNDALHIPTTEKPYLAYLEDGRLLAAGSSGLKATADDGCTWQDVAPFGTMLVPALAAHPDQLGRVYVASYGKGQGGLYVTIDGAATFSLLMPASDTDFIRSVLIAPTDKKRLYATGQTWDTAMPGKYHHYVARSNDQGASWERSDVPLLDSELALLLLAISPKDPALLLAKATASEPRTTPERLLVSRDGGKTFSSPSSIDTLMNAAFSADGSTVWLAGLEGLWRSSDDLQTFAQLTGPDNMSDVVEHAGKLWASGYYAGLTRGDEDGIGVSSNAGDSFEPFLALKDIGERVECDASSATAMLCEMPWSDWQRERAQFGNGSATVSPDAGVAGPDSGMLVTSDGGMVMAPDRDAAGAKKPAVDAAVKPMGAAGANGAHHSSGGCNASHVAAAQDRGAAFCLTLLFALRRRIRGKSPRRE